MDGISRKINKEKALGTFYGLKMIDEVSISHLFFVNDILPFGMISRA